MSGSNSNPDCPNASDPSLCRITFMRSVQQPMVSWTPVYDGSGQMVSQDPNTYTTTYSCSVCAMNWEFAATGGAPAVYAKLPSTKEGKRGDAAKADRSVGDHPAGAGVERGADGGAGSTDAAAADPPGGRQAGAAVSGTLRDAKSK